MKIHILNYPSEPIGNNIRLLDASNPEMLEFHQDNADNTTTDWTISREDFLAAPDLKWPEPIPLVTVTSDWTKANSVGGHQWMSNDTHKAVKQILGSQGPVDKTNLEIYVELADEMNGLIRSDPSSPLTVERQNIARDNIIKALQVLTRMALHRDGE